MPKLPPHRTPSQWARFFALQDARHFYDDYIQNRREPVDRFIYFITAPGNVIKIGHSFNPDARLKSLMRSCPFSLTLRGVVPGAPKLEGYLHEKFAAQRTKGEWFKATKRLLQFVDCLINERGQWADHEAMRAHCEMALDVISPVPNL